MHSACPASMLQHAKRASSLLAELSHKCRFASSWTVRIDEPCPSVSDAHNQTGAPFDVPARLLMGPGAPAYLTPAHGTFTLFQAAQLPNSLEAEETHMFRSCKRAPQSSGSAMLPAFGTHAPTVFQDYGRGSRGITVRLQCYKMGCIDVRTSCHARRWSTTRAANAVESR